MENFYTQSDIEEFLAQQDYGLWTKQVIDKKTSKPRPAKDEDFENGTEHTLEMLDTYDDKTYKAFEISNFKFAEVDYSGAGKILKNIMKLSTGWCETLLEVNGIEYAEYMEKYCDHNIALIDADLQKKSKLMTPQKQKKFEAIKSYFQKLRSMAKTRIKELQNSVTV